MDRLPLSEILALPDFQSRTSENTIAITEYTSAMKDGNPFPPIDVAFIDGKYYVCDGHHRLAAAKLAGLEDMEVNIVATNMDDARWHAWGANMKHGLNLTQAEKRKIAREAIRLYGVNTKKPMSNREIAKKIGLSYSFISKMTKKTKKKPPATTETKSSQPLNRPKGVSINTPEEPLGVETVSTQTPKPMKTDELSGIVEEKGTSSGLDTDVVAVEPEILPAIEVMPGPAVSGLEITPIGEALPPSTAMEDLQYLYDKLQVRCAGLEEQVILKEKQITDMASELNTLKQRAADAKAAGSTEEPDWLK